MYMRKKGIQKEWQLAQFLKKKKYTVSRTKGSGGGTPKPLPDMVATLNNRRYAIELKTSTKDSIHITSRQITDLKEYSRSNGAKPLLCAWFSREKPCFLDIRSLSRTKGGNYKVSRESVYHLKKERKIVYL